MKTTLKKWSYAIHRPFLLVKSVHKPDEEDAASWLDLYHLYMQMALLSEYPKRKLYRVTEKGHGVRLRQHSRGDDVRELAPDVIKNKHGLSQILSQGDVLAMLRESSFMLEGNSEPFGLMQKVTGGIPAGPLFWVSMRPEFMEPDGECHVCLPVWMHHALNHGVFDEVVLPPAPLKVAIKAGDAVGFLGAQDISENGYTRESRTEYKAHIELLSTDAHVPDVLANIKDIKSGAQYVKLKLKRPFYLRNGDGDDATFSPMSAITRKDGDMILRRETTHPFRDKDGVVWFQIRPHTWMHQDDVEQLSQHDLTQLNFTAIVAEPTIDFSHPLDESWVTEAVKSLASHFDAEKGPDSAQAKTFFDGLLGQLRARNAGGMTEWDSSELNKRLFNVLHSSQMNLPELTRRLVVKHDSDWHGGSENSRWSRLFGDGWQPMNGVNKLFLRDHEWMSKVPPFMEGKPVWHFHPLEFLETIKDDEIISLKEARVRAFMRMLRVGEGTVGEYGYETLFGGQSFIKDFHKDFSDHPQISITRGGLTSSAAGAYQVMGYTWNDKSMVSARSKYGINDFSPKSQDEFCIILFKMKRKGSLDKIASGDIDGALASLSYEWASLPPGRYGQPSKSRSEAIDLFEKYLNEEINGKTDLHIPIGYYWMISNMKKALVILLLLFPLCGLASSQKNVWGTTCDVDGFTIDLSSDNTEIVINDNQIVISARIVKVDGDDIDIFFYETRDLGRGGMNLHWSSFDKTKKIAEMKLINGKGFFRWFGFFNKKENKYDWVKDPDFVQSFSSSGLIEMKSCS